MVPVFYVNMNPTPDIPSQGGDLASISNARDLMALRGLYAIRYRVPNEANSEVWPRVWKWVSFLHTYRDAIPDAPAELDICGDFLIYLSGLGWKLATENRQSSYLASVGKILTKVKIADPSNLAEFIEGAGGTLEAAAALLTRSLNHYFPTAQPELRPESFHWIDGVFHSLQDLMVLQDARDVMVEAGLVTSLIKVLYAFSTVEETAGWWLDDKWNGDDTQSKPGTIKACLVQHGMGRGPRRRLSASSTIHRTQRIWEFETLVHRRLCTPAAGSAHQFGVIRVMPHKTSASRPLRSLTDPASPFDCWPFVLDSIVFHASAISRSPFAQRSCPNQSSFLEGYDERCRVGVEHTRICVTDMSQFSPPFYTSMDPDLSPNSKPRSLATIGVNPTFNYAIPAGRFKKFTGNDIVVDILPTVWIPTSSVFLCCAEADLNAASTRSLSRSHTAGVPRAAFPISTKNDQDLLQAHQHKIDERVRTIDRYLEDILQKLKSTHQELESVTEHAEAEMERLDRLRRVNEMAGGEYMRKEKITINGSPAVPGLEILVFFDLFGPPKLNVTVTDTESVQFRWPRHASLEHSVEIVQYVTPFDEPNELDHWNKETIRLQDLRQRLDAERRALLREHNAIIDPITHDAFTSSPVRQIPHDVLMEIFTALKRAAHEPNSNYAPGFEGALAKAPDIWRAVACDHALLWSSFSFPILAKNSAQLVELYLQRSKSAPLNVEIDARSHMEAGSTGEEAITLLAAHSQRRFELRIFADQWLRGAEGDVVVHISIPSLQPLRGHLSSLEVLELPLWPGLSNEFVSVPRLHTLRICSSNAGSIDHGHHFDRSLIRRLSLYDGDGDVLAAYPNVTDFTCLETMQYQHHTPLTSPSVSAPACRRVNAWKIQFEQPVGDVGHPLGAYDDWGISNVFRRFTLPGLRSLARSRCNLTKLVLRDTNIRISALLQILELTPDLESLTVLDGHTTMITDRLFSYLGVNPDRPCNLPALSSLTVTGTFAFRTAALVEMLESRAERLRDSDGRPRLNDVFLSFPDREVQEQLLERLRRLDGVKTTVECPVFLSPAPVGLNQMVELNGLNGLRHLN
ncbi:hypothetical protein DFH06DRAFT_1411743 [Mycena polygramma]|nr:hypothetical protein DFH06DRAFT_1411743 [Mycena polygramma]